MCSGVGPVRAPHREAGVSRSADVSSEWWTFQSDRLSAPRLITIPSSTVAILIADNDATAKETMASFRVELDAPNNIVLVMVAEDDGSEHDYQFDFDPRSGRYEFSERDLL